MDERMNYSALRESADHMRENNENIMNRMSASLTSRSLADSFGLLKTRDHESRNDFAQLSASSAIPLFFIFIRQRIKILILKRFFPFFFFPFLFFFLLN